MVTTHLESGNETRTAASFCLETEFPLTAPAALGEHFFVLFSRQRWVTSLVPARACSRIAFRIDLLVCNSGSFSGPAKMPPMPPQ